MIGSIRTLMMTIAFFGLTMAAFAQDPVTQRSNQPAPAPQAQQAPVAPARLVATFEGAEVGLATGPLAFQLYEGGRAVMVDVTKKPVEGTFSVPDGKKLVITFSNCVYEGVPTQDNRIAGTARVTSGPDAGKTWTFNVVGRAALAGRTYTGNETLATYGAVTFRFVDGTTVEMTDRDGTHRGTYSVAGTQVSLRFGATTYTGQVNGQSITGSARDTRNNWTFAVNAK